MSNKSYPILLALHLLHYWLRGPAGCHRAGRLGCGRRERRRLAVTPLASPGHARAGRGCGWRPAALVHQPRAELPVAAAAASQRGTAGPQREELPGGPAGRGVGITGLPARPARHSRAAAGCAKPTPRPLALPAGTELARALLQ